MSFVNKFTNVGSSISRKLRRNRRFPLRVKPSRGFDCLFDMTTEGSVSFVTGTGRLNNRKMIPTDYPSIFCREYVEGRYRRNDIVFVSRIKVDWDMA